MNPYGSTNWWSQAAEGQSMFNAPSSLRTDMQPRPGSGLGAALESTDVNQIKLLLDLQGGVFSELLSAQDQLTQLAKFAPDKETPLAQELGTFFQVAGKLEGDISQAPLPMNDAAVEEFRGDIDVLSADVRNFKMRVIDALRKEADARQKRTAVYAILAGAAAVGVGWYVWHRRKR